MFEYKYIFFAALPFIASFLTAYVSQRGKNEADLSTIDKLTKKVEDVKASINMLIHNRLKYDSERYRVLIEFYEAFLVYYEHLRFTFFSSHREKGVNEETQRKYDKIEDLFTKFIQAHSRLEIFFLDRPSILKAAADAHHACSQLELTVILAIHNIAEVDEELCRIDFDEAMFNSHRIKEVREKAQLIHNEYTQRRNSDITLLSSIVTEVKTTIANEIKIILARTYE